MKRGTKIALGILVCLCLLALLGGALGWYVLSRYIPKREALKLVTTISEGDPGDLRGWPLIDEDDISWLRRAKTVEWSVKDIEFFRDVSGWRGFVDPRRYLPRRAMATFILTGHFGDQEHEEQREAIIYLTRRRFRWRFSLAIIRYGSKEIARRLSQTALRFARG